jgi:molecular chaperone DnaJ
MLGMFEQDSDCPNCRGEGKVISSPCTDCHGTGRVRKIAKVKVKVPPGVESGTRLRVPGAGNAGLRGGSAGDLFIFIEVESSPEFERRGDDIYSEVNVSYVQAVLGDQIDILSPAGKLQIKVPAGSQPGTVLRLRGKGIPHLGGSGFGDHFVTINVFVPKQLNNRQKETLLEYAKAMNEKLRTEEAAENDSQAEKKKKNFFWES